MMKYVFLLAIFLASVTTAYADAQPTRDCTYLGNDLKRHPGTQQYVEGMGWGPCKAAKSILPVQNNHGLPQK